MKTWNKGNACERVACEDVRCEGISVKIQNTKIRRVRRCEGPCFTMFFTVFFACFRFKYYLLLNSHIFRDTKFWLSHGLIHLFLVISPLTIFIDVSSFYFSFQPTFLIWSKGQLILHVLPMIFAWTYHLLCLNNPSLSLSLFQIKSSLIFLSKLWLLAQNVF